MACMWPLGFSGSVWIETLHFCEPQGSWICLIAIFHEFISRGPNCKGQPEKQGSVLGKCPAMSNSLVKGGSPDPETSPGQGGEFVLSVQVMWSSVWVSPKASVSPRIALASDFITWLIQVGLNDKEADFIFMGGKNECWYTLMRAIRYICMYLWISIFIKVKFAHSLKWNYSCNILTSSTDYISPSKCTKKEQSMPINSSV